MVQWKQDAFAKLERMNGRLDGLKRQEKTVRVF